MRDAAAIRLDIAATSHELIVLRLREKQLRRRLGAAFAEARDHPELTLEEGRRIPTQEISRPTANRLIAEATSA